MGEDAVEALGKVFGEGDERGDAAAVCPIEPVVPVAPGPTQ
jgi:hypothetical protein